MKGSNHIFQIFILIIIPISYTSKEQGSNIDPAMLAALAKTIQDRSVQSNQQPSPGTDGLQESQNATQDMIQNNQELYKEALKQTALKVLQSKGINLSANIHHTRKRRKLDDEVKIKEKRQQANRVYLAELKIALKEFKKKQKEVHESFEKTYKKLLERTERKNKKVLVNYMQNYAKAMEKERAKTREKFQHLTELVDAGHKPYKRKKYKWHQMEKRFRIPGLNTDYGIQNRDEEVEDEFPPSVINASPSDLDKGSKL